MIKPRDNSLFEKMAHGTWPTSRMGGGIFRTQTINMIFVAKLFIGVVYHKSSHKIPSPFIFDS